MSAADGRFKRFGDWWRRFWLPAALLVLSAFFATAATFRYTKTTSFCVGCHEIQAAEATWKLGPHYQNTSGVVAQCSDCHIPPGAGDMVVDKVGRLRELYVHVTQDNSPTMWALGQQERGDRARAHLQNSACLSCHDLAAIRPASETGRLAHDLMDLNQTRCVQCHQHVGHGAPAKGGANS
ncbi:MAG: cytochrome c3 family protein [Bacillota bacterium]